MHNHKKKANIVQVAESVYHAKAHTRETGLRHIGIHLLQKSIVVKKTSTGPERSTGLMVAILGDTPPNLIGETFNYFIAKCYLEELRPSTKRKPLQICGVADTRTKNHSTAFHMLV